MKALKRLASLQMVLIFVIINMLNFVSEAQAAVVSDEMAINDEYVLFEKSALLKDIGTISVKKSVIIDGEKNYLFPTFDDNEAALKEFKKKAEDILKLIENNNAIDELSEDNWQEYYNLAYSLKECDEYQKDFVMVFFDIYENESVNEDIIYCIENETDSGIKRKILYEMLPYTQPFVKSYDSNRVAAYSNFNIEAAVQYAKTYANTPNSYSYQVFEKDCTNFASQIMENGGIPQDNDIEWSWLGWWHVKDGTAHYNSKSWSVADSFAKYFGVDYTTKMHFSFSAHIKKGDFILLDAYSDGGWDHTGFVVDADSYFSNGYYDYLVAQHSSNYLLWTSAGDNHWEEKEAEGYTYGIVRMD